MPQVFQGGTLHSHLYFNPRLQSRSWPINFSCLTPRKSGLDPWLSSINHAHRLPREPLTVSKLPWPLDQPQKNLPWLLDLTLTPVMGVAYVVSPPCINFHYGRACAKWEELFLTIAITMCSCTEFSTLSSVLLSLCYKLERWDSS